MSREAFEYFNDVAALGSIDVPIGRIFQGHNLSVSASNTRLPVHYIEEHRLTSRFEIINDKSAMHLNRVTDFLSSILWSENCFPDLQIDAPVDEPQPPYHEVLFGGIVPSGVKAGHLRDFRIEAVAASDLPESVTDNLDELQQKSPYTALLYGQAHFITTAELHSGRTLGRVGRVVRMAITGRHDEEGRLESIRRQPDFLSSLLVDEQRAAVRQGIRKSHGRAWFAERRAITNPFSGGSTAPK